MEQVIEIVRCPLREGLELPQDDRLANRQADEDAEENRPEHQVVLDRIPKKLAIHHFQECLHVLPSMCRSRDDRLVVSHDSADALGLTLQ